MTDYKRALELGFAAAKKAEIARNEIQEVLKKFKEEILMASGGKLLLELKQLEEAESPEMAVARMFSKVPAPPKTYTALVASNPTAAKINPRSLARWKQSKDGYPCVLSWNNQEVQCEDRAALEMGLSEILQDPVIGERLYALSMS